MNNAQPTTFAYLHIINEKEEKELVFHLLMLYIHKAIN